MLTPEEEIKAKIDFFIYYLSKKPLVLLAVSAASLLTVLLVIDFVLSAHFVLAML